MINNFLYYVLSSKFTKYFPKTINRKLLRKFEIFFIPINFKKLPKNYYPIFTSITEQKKIFINFEKHGKLIKFNTKKNIDFFIKNIVKNKKISFLDVGGDSIDLYLSLKKIIKLRSYYIYNFIEILDIFKSLKKKFFLKDFYLTNRIENIKKIDFVYFGASIQYFKNYKNFLFKIIKKKPKYIFFTGTNFIFDEIDNEDLVVKQTNILPNLVYCYFFNFYSFKNFFKRNKYRLLFFERNKYAKINYNNFKPLYKDIRYLDLLFVRES